MKSQCDKFEEEVNSARRDVGAVQKEMQSVNKVINQVISYTLVDTGQKNGKRQGDKRRTFHCLQLEAAVEQEKADRHSLLKHCKMFNIPIPMSKGNLEDIDDDGQNDDPSIELSNS